jgi:hypothetical protein
LCNELIMKEYNKKNWQSQEGRKRKTLDENTKGDLLYVCENQNKDKY